MKKNVVQKLLAGMLTLSLILGMSGVNVNAEALMVEDSSEEILQIEEVEDEAENTNEEMEKEDADVVEYDLTQYADVDVSFVTCVQFTDEQAKEYQEALEADLEENIEHLTNELMLSEDDATSEYLEQCIEKISDVDTSDVFCDDENNVIEIPMRAIEIENDSIDEITDENGTVTVDSEEAEELITEYDSNTINEVEVEGDSVTITTYITADDFAEGGMAMSENMLEGEGQKVVKDSVKRKKGHVWGKNYSASRCVYSTKKYRNIVHCNKCSKSKSENVKSAIKWLAGGSDCARAIRLGTLYLLNPTSYVLYAQNVVCVIESCQSLGNEGRNIYCNGDKKSGPHWNCSWFSGIWHTESFHYHK